ncbi:hypothetical protein IV203_013682 [Nitzschia inconspicua]|uniref:Uncharacterized protein n=1 Tax=Nitzschia inconspicua TaxID=303405 RepID=A0A9K3M5Z0_9STRA|nr:hypothetical protein IV203_013682 [Nitzschia inconspicua]
MVDCQPESLAFETPFSRYNQCLISNPFDRMPSTPRISNRCCNDTSKRLLSNVDRLSVPSLNDSRSNRRISSFPAMYTGSASDRPSFDAALQRMRDGRGLQRLRAERDNGEPLPISPPSATSPEVDSKPELSHSSAVTLSKKMPRRNSGVALSA